MVGELNSAFSGKGGGKDNYAQGKLTSVDKEALSDFITKLLK